MDRITARFHVTWPGFTLDLDLDLPGRGLTAIFGHSGSGKTTLLRCIAGLERAEQGYLSFNGEVWQDQKTFLPTYKRPLGYVFQEASLFPHLTVLRNLRYGLTRSKAEQNISLDHAIELLGIGALLERKPERLSGGERQRVGIARALAVSPRILLMDEPLAALDLARKQEVLPYLERLRDELEIPILYVTHSPDEVGRLANHLVALAGGSVVAQGLLAETLSRIDLPIRLGEERGVVLEGIVSERDEEWHLERVEFPGGFLWMRDRSTPLGHTVRVRIPSGGISLSRLPQQDSSILNTLAGVVEAIGEDDHPAHSLVRVRVGESVLLARITKRSAAALELRRGLPVWAQVKSVAVAQ
ncbi:MAG: molybdenum ABC transporter ATP-binding protein [Desulfuromonadaceae bacterium]|nr:molybdenum ABC transporter ATP-binding protein [Desulfuromonadaceae bacterium]MDD2848997.1 molybdenum ABC transporter ATP-binding protein [Desulfuromonadaceae bacterium]MDD4131846.1 molybdenum ABC transporter ATP-binding protein [Desulfuromonadaceae bacterium]